MREITQKMPVKAYIVSGDETYKRKQRNTS